MILTEQQYQTLPDTERNHREVWMYQDRAAKKWDVFQKITYKVKFENFGLYADYMYDKHDRATKRIYISRAEPKPGDTIAVYFSCGAASAMAVKRTIEKYGHICTIKIVNNPIKEEDDDNQRFLQDVAKWLNIDIEKAVNSKYKSCSAVEVWEDRQYMAGVKGAPCTTELKKKARYEWELKIDPIGR
jgi:hypothetical protein